MFKYTFTFFICSLLVVDVFSQKHTISGYVTDRSSGEKLINASVYDGYTYGGTISNEYGYFSLTLPGDSVLFTVSYVGYTTSRVPFHLTADTIINIELESSFLLSEVVISAEKNGESLQERTQMSTMEIPIEQIKALPAFLGEVDVLKSLQLLPGVSGGTEGSSGLFVRGGSPDQNLILLDGVPVYNASHLFGFFSVFNSDAINKVTLIKGGFPARYGGRLSSVIDIRMKEGNQHEFHGEGSIGLVASRFTFEGPIIKDKSSFIVSARRTYIDIITRPIVQLQNDGDVAGYFFYDLNAKVNHKFSDKDRLYASGYFGRDKAYFKSNFASYETGGQDISGSDQEDGLFWGNATAVVRWNHVYDKKLFSNLTATFTDYKFDIYSNSETSYADGTSSLIGFEYYSGIYDWSLKYDFDFIPAPNHYLKFGAGTTLHTFQPGATQFVAENIDVEFPEIDLTSGTLKATEFDLYAEDDWEMNSQFKVNYGLHASGFAVEGELYQSLQPRISMRYLLNPDISLKASFSTMTQYIHLLTNSGIGLPTDLWVPATDTIPPQSAWQAAIGSAWTFQNDLEISLEGYYKRMKNIIEYKDGASYLYDGFDNWENKVESGTGDAYGIELFIQKREGNFTGWLGYTLSWSNRIFPTINLGDEFPYKYDRRHDFEIAGIYKINDHIDISADFVFTSGQPISLPIAKYTGTFGEIIYAYEGRNGYRMNPYHRMDVNIAFHREKTNWTRTWNFGAYNLYNHKNPFFIYLDYDPAEQKQFYNQVSIFPVIPYASYEFKF